MGGDDATRRGRLAPGIVHHPAAMGGRRHARLPLTQRTVAPTHAGNMFQTSHECFACHNGLMPPSGEDVSIGIAWRASMMANSSRDPY
jgi:hypothetical protein